MFFDMRHILENMTSYSFDRHTRHQLISKTKNSTVEINEDI